MLRLHLDHSRRRDVAPPRPARERVERRERAEGPPSRLGAALGQVFRQLAFAANWPLLGAIFVLVTLGVVSIYADTREDATREWAKQIAFVALGLACMAAFQAINYQVLGRYAWPFYFLSLALIVYTVIGGFADGKGMPLPGVRKINGAYPWINIRLSSSFVFSLQPSELAKIAFVMVMARYLRFRSNYRTLKGLLPPFALAFVPLVLILKQPDLGTALVFVPVLFAMLFVAGAKLRHLAAVAGLGLVLAPVIWLAGTSVPVLKHLPALVKGYQRERVLAMFSHDPKTRQGSGFQQEHAMIALGSGGFVGKGFGNIPVGEIVPESHNDMIFALIGEQFGFFGSAAVLGAFLVLFAAGINISGNTREPFGRLVAAGIVSVFAGQTFINLMVAMRMMPVTGVTLPFVGYGGSSLLASFMAAGLLLNIGQNRPLVMAKDSFEFGG